MAGALGKSCELVGAVNGKTCFGNVYVIAAAPKSTGKGAASSIASPLITASGEMAREFRENVLPDLKVESQTLKRESEDLYKQITKGGVTEAEKEMLKARLGENQRKMDANEPLLIATPTY